MHRLCLLCSCGFYQTRTDQVYCSRRCMNNVSSQRYRNRNPERRKAVYTKSYYKCHSVRLITQRNANVQRYYNISGYISESEWNDLVAAFGSRCAYCHKLCDRPTQDHIVPLTKGGLHHIDNILPACQSCNSRKGNKDVGIFLVEIKWQPDSMAG